jgi:hypothetical protein
MAMMVECGELAWKVDSIDSPFSGMLHIVELALLRLSLWWANMKDRYDKPEWG